MTPSARQFCAPAFALLMLGAPLGAQVVDGATRICLERDSQAICDCASAVLQQQVSADDYTLYGSVTNRYLDRVQRGEDRVDAGKGASAAISGETGSDMDSQMRRTNDIGLAHGAAIKACRG